eukprot:Gregarina_sp_Poly_1__3179@NODE_1901_length_3120_cov_57_141173_g1230_i0_p3_GENE_NODE_1901_length_3120_cov_57_141173_g1230_i0NODE_1901_length_3120_cov_57_141173_g1230_i0_p3_ORF_typecomplete_len100_score8_92_NODE_1901_length_3120_cov_57_141173_g1230_i023132612
MLPEKTTYREITMPLQFCLSDFDYQRQSFQNAPHTPYRIRIAPYLGKFSSAAGQIDSTIQNAQSDMSACLLKELRTLLDCRMKHQSESSVELKSTFIST